jgi:hypothetical protein
MDATVCFAGSERMSHAIGCACCTPRSAVAEALGRLLLARARGEVPWFTRVVAATVTPAGEAAVRAAVAQDPIAGARFRIG